MVRRRRFLGAGRRLLTRLVDRLPRPTYHPTGSLRPERAAPGAGHAAAAIGHLWQATEQPVRAQRALERAARWNDQNAVLDLGHALLSGGPSGLDVVEYVGLTESTTGDPAAARAVFASIEPDSPLARRAQRGRASALLAEHRVEEAKAAARAHGDSDDIVAAASIVELEMSGHLTRDQLTAIIPLLESHLERHPRDTTTRQRLARILLSLLRFDEALGLAAPGDASNTTHELAVWTRETAAGNHRAARLEKERAARRISTRRARSTGSMTDHVVRVQALNYTEGPAAALAELDRRWIFAPTRSERAVRRKLHADLSLLCGDPEPLRALAELAPSHNRRATDLFRATIAGRRVLLIGPAPAHQPDAELIERHDAVVTTRRPFVFPPDLDLPSVTYLTNESALTEVEEHAAWLAAPDRMVVLRPSMIRRSASALTEHDQARLQPFEDATPLFGTHFAMQRIIHDLLANEAAEVTLSGVDFFLGTTTHVDGYASGTSDRFARAPFNYSHDFAFDFWYTQTLQRHGLVSGHEGVLQTLDQSIDSYLDRLPRVFL